MIDPEQKLFQAVVTQALLDAVSEPKTISEIVKRKAKEGDVEYEERRAETINRRRIAAAAERDEAREWLLSDMTAFPLITTLAGYNPTDIRERARRLAARGWPQPDKSKITALAA